MERSARAPHFFPDWERNGSVPGENDPRYYKGMIAQCKLKKNPKPKPIQNRKPHGAFRGPARKLSIFYWMFASSRARRTMSKPKDPMWLFSEVSISKTMLPGGTKQGKSILTVLEARNL